METKRSINLGTIGKIVIPENVQKIIDKLHKKIGATEWSGALFYSLKEGEIKNLKDLVFEAKFLYPMDIGNGAYTEYDFDGELMEAYDLCEEAIELHRGHIHTHHSLSTFFSGTDTSELLDNAKFYNFYISLIVNFDGKYCCKMAMPSVTEAKYMYSIKDQDGKTVKLQSTKEEDIILVGDLTVERLYIPVEERDWIDTRVDELRNRKKVTPAITFPANQQRILFDKDDFATEYKKFEKQFDDTPDVVTEAEFLCAILADDAYGLYLGVDYQIEEVVDEYERDILDLKLLKEILYEDFDEIFEELFPMLKNKAMRNLTLEKTKKLLLEKEKLFKQHDKLFNLYLNLLKDKINE